MKRLLAKSSRSPDEPRSEETLPGHTACVLAAADRIVALRAKLAWQALGDTDTAGVERLGRCVRLAAFLHDLGKCADTFQQMVRGGSGGQCVRHEAASFLLCQPNQPVGQWILRCGVAAADLNIALAAAGGHHRKFPDSAVPHEFVGAVSATLLCGHPDFLATLNIGRRHFDWQVEPPPVANLTLPMHTARDIEDLARNLDDALTPEDRDIFLPVVKGLLIAADVAGSALPRSGEKFVWIDGALAERETGRQLQRVVDRRLGGSAIRPFQEAVAGSAAPMTLVTAGCGTGKTVAAYAWAARQHPHRRLWVTYPTTGTATEGFRDYIHDADLAGRLDHSRVEVDLELLGLVEPDMPDRENDRLAALRAWQADAVVCTVDTVLGLLQNHRKGLYAFAALCNAAVVFDEIHAYDDRLFGTLLRFLRQLPGIPALLMTASLPAARLAALQQAAHLRGQESLAIVSGPTEIEVLPRYRRADSDPFEATSTAVANLQRVLWVCNTVNRCIDAFDRLSAAGLPTICYHSRFTYRDRVARHAAVVEAFRRPAPIVAVTTQVAEMSLDLSAELLVTDLAPIPSLIQRLGRLNRRSTAANPAPVRQFVVLDFRGDPYADADLSAAQDWLRTLGDGDLSQRDLVAAWSVPAGAMPITAGASAWIDGGAWTAPDSLRQDGVGLTVLRQTDAVEVRAHRASAIELALPMGPPPRKHNWLCWKREHWLPVAPNVAIDYDAVRGARWA